MNSLATQTVTAEEFERLVQAHPNPVITADYRYQYVTFGRRMFRTELVSR